MADVRIDLDDAVIKRLEGMARRNGRTLEDEAWEIIVRAAPLTPEERVALSREIRGMQANPSDLRSEDLIRKARDNR